MKHIVIFFAVTIIPFWSISQFRNDNTDPWQEIFSSNHIGISVFGGLASKANVTANPEKYNIGSSPQIAFGGAINRHFTLKNDLSIITGLSFIGIGRNFEFLIPKEDFDPDYERDVFLNGPTSTEMVFLLRIPVTAEKRWYTGKGYLSFNSGISLMYAFLQEEEIYHSIIYPNGQQVRFLYKLLQTNNNKKPWFNYSIGGGYGWALKNRNLLSINLSANLSLTKFINGYYYIDVPSQATVEGNYLVKGSYIALSGSYILTGVKKRIKRLK